MVGVVLLGNKQTNKQTKKNHPILKSAQNPHPEEGLGTPCPLVGNTGTPREESRFEVVVTALQIASHAPLFAFLVLSCFVNCLCLDMSKLCMTLLQFSLTNKKGPYGNGP